MQRLGAAPLDRDPLDVLKELAGEALALKAFLARRVQEMQELRSYSPGLGDKMRAEFEALERATRQV